MIFDTHAHYDSRQFDEDRDTVFQSMSQGFKIVNVGADIKSSEAAVAMAEKYDFVYAAVGAHPDEVGELFGLHKTEEDEEDGTIAGNGGPEGTDKSEPTINVEELDCTSGISVLRNLAKSKKVISIGEIGLDYHWNIWAHEIQHKAFIAQWELAAELGLPIEIHSRDAAEDTMKIVKSMHEKYPEIGIDMHCYSYSLEQAKEYVKMGMMFGIGGVSTFKNAKKLKEVITELPMDRILLETDCPYLAPEPHRGERNYSGFLSLVADQIGLLKGMSTEDVLKYTEENAMRFFRL